MVEEKAVRIWYIKEKRQFTFEYQFSIFLASKTGTDPNFAVFLVRYHSEHVMRNCSETTKCKN